MTISDLIERLERAESADRELDYWICWVAKMDPWAAETADQIASLVELTMPRCKQDKATPAFTASVDAAIALAERLLPGFGISIDTHPVYGDWWDASIFNRMPMTISNARKQTGPLALCLAILRALQAKEAQP